jgi:hypothetical protein
VRILRDVVGEMCHVVIVFVFVIGSKWISGVGRRGEREVSDSKSETSNQSVLG